MTHLHVVAGSESTATLPVVRKIGMIDLKEALAKGLDDFRAFPTHVMFLIPLPELIESGSLGSLVPPERGKV
jgi:uncharacterized membrane protein